MARCGNRLFIGRSFELADRAFGQARPVRFARVERCHGPAAPSEQGLELGDGCAILGGATRSLERVLLTELARGTLDVVLLALPIGKREFETVRLFEDLSCLRCQLAIPGRKERA
jgi:hypothetical protein